MKRPIFHVDLLYFLPNGNSYFLQIRHSNLVQNILSACMCLCLKLAWAKYCTLNLWNQVGGCIWRRQGPKPLGSSATGSQVLQMDGARVQPCGHLRLPPAHPGLRHLGHGLPRAGRAGVHPLEVLGRAQFHLALYWGPGKRPFV